MPIDVQCTGCSTTLRAPDNAAGKKIKCPKCAAVIPVPAASGADITTAPPPAPPAPEMEMAKAAPAPKRRRDEDDEPPSRRRRFEDDEDRPRRHRGPRRDAHETEASGTVPLILGIVSIVFSAMAVPLAFMGCCPPIGFIAAALAALGLLLGGGGIVVAIMQKKGLPCPCIGMGLSVVALVVCLAWAIWWGKTISDVNKTQQGIQDQIQLDMERARKQQEDFQRQQKERAEREKKEKEEAVSKIINDPLYQDHKKKSQANLKKIADALLKYEETHGSLPHANWGGVNKEGQLSWRVAILPFMGYEDHYKRFDPNKHWIDQINQKAGANMPIEFQSPRHPGDKTRTYYRVLTQDGLFGNFNRKTTNLPRPKNSVFMVLEADHAAEWYQGHNDIHYFANTMPGVGKVLQDKAAHEGGGHFNAAMASGDVYFISRASWPDDQLRGMMPYNGGSIPFNWPPPK